MVSQFGIFTSLAFVLAPGVSAGNILDVSKANGGQITACESLAQTLKDNHWNDEWDYQFSTPIILRDASMITTLESVKIEGWEGREAWSNWVFVPTKTETGYSCKLTDVATEKSSITEYDSDRLLVYLQELGESRYWFRVTSEDGEERGETNQTKLDLENQIHEFKLSRSRFRKQNNRRQLMSRENLHELSLSDLKVLESTIAKQEKECDDIAWTVLTGQFQGQNVGITITYKHAVRSYEAAVKFRGQTKAHVLKFQRLSYVNSGGTCSLDVKDETKKIYLSRIHFWREGGKVMLKANSHLLARID